MSYKGEKNNINSYQLSDKINPLTIVGLILLFSVVLTTGGEYQYWIALVFALGLLLLFSFKKALSITFTLTVIWGLLYLLKPYLGSVFVGSIYTLLLIIIKFSPIFILGSVLSSYSSSRLMSAFRKIRIGKNISIGVTIFFRFVPEISIRMKEIGAGMKIRGFKASILRPIRSFELYLVPLIYKCIDISDTLTSSIISKGIEYEGKKTSFHEVKFSCYDLVVLMIGIVLVGVSIWEIF